MCTCFQLLVGQVSPRLPKRNTFLKKEISFCNGNSLSDRQAITQKRNRIFYFSMQQQGRQWNGVYKLDIVCLQEKTVPYYKDSCTQYLFRTQLTSFIQNRVGPFFFQLCSLGKEKMYRFVRTDTVTQYLFRQSSLRAPTQQSHTERKTERVFLSVWQLRGVRVSPLNPCHFSERK